MELERQENILIIGHQAILRCLYAYFHNLPHEDLPYIKIPLHTVIKLTPKAYGCDEERWVLQETFHLSRAHRDLRHRYTLPIGAVDTHRPKPGTVQPKVPPTTSGREYFANEDEQKA